ncbi:lysozyme inhibitor LprI family protein [Caulobacter sp. BP25]|uniref:lysozyme inhibitor LprI family protein n=1 Tax=Caulobacter sp. BP25 TaxID=2048900 RepID=UPI000C12CD07|nr:lysozyme inhibitor LprI family protein [Caulobacter sp. BP25]PHY21796.1 hypothetical protein CSW59_03810 [Caulobacter sp. BP25]
MSALLFALALASVPQPRCPNAVTTIEVNTCLGAALMDLDKEMDRYYDAAVARLTAEHRAPANDALSELARAQTAWRTYRDAECGAVYSYWREGTIRTTVALDCQISLTRLRVFSLWRDWLTYPDSTPPILPRPDLAAALAEGLR